MPPVLRPEDFKLSYQRQQLARSAEILTDSSFLTGVAALAAILLAGFALIAWIRRWQKRNAADKLSAFRQLQEFEQLYQQGDLEKEEFEQIRRLWEKNNLSESDDSLDHR